MAEARPRRRATAVVGATLAAVLLAACGGTTSNGAVVSGYSEDSDGMHGAVLDDRYQLDGPALVDTAGEPFAPVDRLSAPVTVVFFGYTQCPDICQAVMATVTSALARLDADDAAKVEMWFVTSDPARDDPATLREYLDRFDPSFEGLTGPLRDIVPLAKSAHIAIEKGPRLPSGGYEVNHGTPLLAVLPDGSVPVVWTEGTSAAQLAEDLTAILAGELPEPTSRPTTEPTTEPTTQEP